VLLAAVDDPSRMVILEEWDSIDAHKSAAKAIPTAEIQRVMPLLAAPPKGQSYE
jgi:hypothetical protein